MLKPGYQSAVVLALLEGPSHVSTQHGGTRYTFAQFAIYGNANDVLTLM